MTCYRFGIAFALMMGFSLVPPNHLVPPVMGQTAVQETDAESETDADTANGETDGSDADTTVDDSSEAPGKPTGESDSTDSAAADEDDAAEMVDETDGASEETASDETSSEAADAAAPTQPESEVAAAATGAIAGGLAMVEFQAKFEEWKSLLKELREIRAEFLIVPESEMARLQEQFASKIDIGHRLERELYETGLAAFIEAPNEDRELTRFLISAAADMVNRDDYRAAIDLLLPLLAADADEKQLFDLAGRAAYGTNDFERAEALLKDAAATESISNEGMQQLESIDEVQATWQVETALRDAEADADDLPRVRLQTSEGDIVLELFENEALETVGNFISLVENGFYDQLTFHRVIKGFMAQAGCPDGDGTRGPGYNIYCECVNDDHRNHFAGSLSMAKSNARNTGGSQFFITFNPTPFLNGQHTVFGRVVEGWDVLPKIIRREPDQKPSMSPSVIEKAEVVRKRDHEYRPNKVN